MALISPGIDEREQNFTQTASAAGFGSAATVGKFQWGPALELATVADEVSLLQQFGEPNRRTQPSWYSAQRILTQSNDLKLVRVINRDEAKNSHPAIGAVRVTITQPGTGYLVGDAVQVLDGSGADVVGATGEVVRVGADGEVELIRVFPGEITTSTDTSSYSLDITTVGGVGAAGTVAVISESPVLVANSQDIDAGAIQSTDLETTHNTLGYPALFAKFAGDFGDKISFDLVSFEKFSADPAQTLTTFPSADTVDVDFSNFFESGPRKPGQYGVVVYQDGVPTSNFVFSLNEGDRDGNGASIFLDDLVDFEKTQNLIGTSNYGWSEDRTGRYQLAGGVDTGATTGDWITAWDLLSDPEIVQFQYAAAGAAANESIADSSIIQKHIVAVMEQRKDARARLSPPRDLVVGVGRELAIDNIIAWRKGVDASGTPVEDNLNVSTTYSSLEEQFKYQYDKFNDQYFWMGLSADATAADLFNAREFFPWMSAAGSERSQIRGIVKLAYTSSNQGQRNRLYKASINPVMSEPGGGTYINGDKTLTNADTAFSRINVRDLFNLLKRSIRPLAKTKMFELNNEFNRSLFRQQSTSFIAEIQGLGGVVRFQVICDETNNTAQVIDNNQFVGTFRIVPPRSVNFITLNFGAFGSDVNFDELG